MMRLIGALVLALITGTAGAETITSARFSEPTTQYNHGVLGDAVEWRALEIVTDTRNADGTSGAAVFRKKTYRIQLPVGFVFEDTAPRLADVTGDGKPEVIVVETALAKGAALAIYNIEGRLTKTPHIGQTHRWLAPIGAADLDGDGHIEIAYIDRPHLAKTLRVWRYRDGALREVADKAGLTNHKIGWDHIPGGLRACDGAPQLITANANWTRIMATSLDGKVLRSREIGTYSGASSLNAAVRCD